MSTATATTRRTRPSAQPAPVDDQAYHHIVNEPGRAAIKKAIEQARRLSRNEVNVPAHKRRLILLPDQIRMDRAFEQCAHLFNTAASVTVSARDRGHAQRLIEMLQQSFGV